MMVKDVPGFEGLYCASEDGTVYSLIQNSSRRKGPLKPLMNSCGYYRVNLFDANGKKHRVFVHRLIASLFVPNPGNYRVVNHIDADKANNAAGNLEWCTQKANIAHSRALGNQHKDKRVFVLDSATGKRVVYPNMRTASTALYGKYWTLGQKRKNSKGPIHDGTRVIMIDGV